MKKSKNLFWIILTLVIFAIIIVAASFYSLFKTDIELSTASIQADYSVVSLYRDKKGGLSAEEIEEMSEDLTPLQETETPQPTAEPTNEIKSSHTMTPSQTASATRIPTPTAPQTTSATPAPTPTLIITPKITKTPAVSTPVPTKAVNTTIYETEHEFEYTSSYPASVFEGEYKLYRCTVCGELKKIYSGSSLGTSAVKSDLCSMVDYTLKPMENLTFSELMGALAEGDLSATVSIDKQGFYCFYYRHYYLYSMFYVFQSDTNLYCLKARSATSFSEYEKTLTWADGVIQELGITKSTRQIDAIKKINRYLVEYYLYENVDSKEGDGQGAYRKLWSSIETHNAVCSQYSQTFQLLCHKCGIKCGLDCHFNDTLTSGHAYNSIKFSDGTILYVDTTWNDVQLKYQGSVYDVVDLAEKLFVENVSLVNGMTKEMFVGSHIEKYLLIDFEDLLSKHSWTDADYFTSCWIGVE